jgi:DNA-binding transcriptional MerR regulator
MPVHSRRNRVDELVSVGGVAQRAGCSPSNIVRLERLQAIPKSLRVSGSNRRVWRIDDVRLIEEVVKQRRADRIGTAA